VALAAYVERSSKRNRDIEIIDKQSIPAIIKDHVVHRRKVVMADVEFAFSSLIDRKVMDFVAVSHRESVVAALQAHRTTM